MLIRLGRLTQADVDRTLEHQKQHGGYFGQALLALGLVTRQELDWILASQFDLPYIVPDPTEVDLTAAQLVTPHWVLAHLVLPILQTADSVTVLVAAPNQEAAALEELRLGTGRRLELAMASPAAVRRVIQDVYGRIAAHGLAGDAATPLRALWDEARMGGAAAFGVSVRGVSARGWFEADGRRERRNLDGRWEADLDRMLHPGLAEAMGEREMAEWRADLEVDGTRIPVDVAGLRTPDGSELVIRPVVVRALRGMTLVPPQPDVVAEVSRLMHSGGARIRVVSDPPALSPTVTPHLPALLLGDAVRSAHVTDTDGETPEGVLTIRLSADADSRARQLAGIRAFSFDVLTAALTGPVAQLADLAPSLFVASGDDVVGGRRTGLDWELRVAGTDWGRLYWSLHAVAV